MKPQFLLCLALFTSQLLLSQAPKSPSGDNLYRKGDCERVSVKFVSCTYCEDKELTKNCKEYWCTDDGTCTEAPKKNPNGELTRIDFGNGKYVDLKKEDTTSKLPKGVKVVNGKITIQNGYKAVSSSNNKIVFILSAGAAGGVRGGFRCDCESTDGSCNSSVINNKIVCGGDACCKIVVTIYGGDDLTMQKAEEKPEKLKWKKLVLPTKSN